jgi:uncharacterized iron-regulated membrane protein
MRCAVPFISKPGSAAKGDKGPLGKPPIQELTNGKANSLRASYAALRSARCCKSTEGYSILSTISLRTSKGNRAAFYNPNFGIYGVRFFHPGDDHGAAGVGPAILYYDGVDGRSLGARVPWVGTAADIFLQAQFPVHSGRILGLPGRILVSFMGFVTMVLSVTGVVIW